MLRAGRWPSVAIGAGLLVTACGQASMPAATSPPSASASSLPALDPAAVAGTYGASELAPEELQGSRVIILDGNDMACSEWPDAPLCFQLYAPDADEPFVEGPVDVEGNFVTMTSEGPIDAFPDCDGFVAEFTRDASLAVMFTRGESQAGCGVPPELVPQR